MVSRSATKDELHGLIDDLADEDLAKAKVALRYIRDQGFDATEDEQKELLERQAECDRGEVVAARAFLEELHKEATHSDR